MPDTKIIKPFEAFFVTVIFVFSTMYGLYFYWAQGTNEQMKVGGLDEAGDNTFGGFLNIILDVASWLSPFAAVKYMMLSILPADLYLFIDLFFLRPIGWMGALFTANYIISKIPTVSGE